MIKIVSGGEFDVAKKTVVATKLLDDDEVIHIEILREQRNTILQSKDGYFLRFVIEDIPEKKKNAVGARGLRLKGTDYIENVYFTENAEDTSVKYKGKVIELNKLKLGRRDGTGVKVRV